MTAAEMARWLERIASDEEDEAGECAMAGRIDEAETKLEFATNFRDAARMLRSSEGRSR